MCSYYALELLTAKTVVLTLRSLPSEVRTTSQLCLLGCFQQLKGLSELLLLCDCTALHSAQGQLLLSGNMNPTAVSLLCVLGTPGVFDPPAPAHGLTEMPIPW